MPTSISRSITLTESELARCRRAATREKLSLSAWFRKQLGLKALLIGRPPRKKGGKS